MDTAAGGSDDEGEREGVRHLRFFVTRVEYLRPNEILSYPLCVLGLFSR